jgi:hypothetical protein
MLSKGKLCVDEKRSRASKRTMFGRGGEEGVGENEDEERKRRAEEGRKFEDS